ncbi:MAG: glucokinase [Spirochaetaceae bacterium]
MSQPTTSSWLVCDAGGTNCTFALVGHRGGSFTILARSRYASRSITDFTAVMIEASESLLTQTRADAISGACISAAGPVHDGRVTLTNTNWSIDEAKVSEGLGVPTHLVNDLTAIGYGLPLINRTNHDECVSVWRPESSGQSVSAVGPDVSVQAVAAAGTGLGVAIVCEQSDGAMTVLPSEGGHSDLTGFDDETKAFQRFVEASVSERPDAELYASGKGLRYAASFLISEGRFREGAVQEILKVDAAEYPALVSRHASSHPDAAQAMRLFAKMYGRFVAGLALTVLPYGGLFLAGGVTARNLDAIIGSGFLEGYFSHPHESMQSSLRRVPVYALRDYDISLLGAAHAAYAAKEKRW